MSMHKCCLAGNRGPSSHLWKQGEPWTPSQCDKYWRHVLPSGAMRKLVGGAVGWLQGLTAEPRMLMLEPCGLTRSGSMELGDLPVDYICGPEIQQSIITYDGESVPDLVGDATKW